MSSPEIQQKQRGFTDGDFCPPGTKVSKANLLYKNKAPHEDTWNIEKLAQQAIEYLLSSALPGINPRPETSNWNLSLTSRSKLVK
jgi:hypothetical protein